MSKVSIRSSCNGKTLIFIDDREIENVINLEFKATPCKVPVLKLEIAPSELEINGDLVEVVEELNGADNKGIKFYQNRFNKVN